VFKQSLLLPHLVYVLINEKIFIKSFGERLRKIRLSKNLSQADLANTAEIPINQVGRIERGEINTTLTTIKVLTDSLKIDVTELFKNE
jgi:transcriptional regulator with XRE-family HTH domain